MFKQFLSQKSFSLISRNQSTIFALSSGHGKCGVAVIRVSGSSTELALKSLTGLTTLPTPRTATLRSIRHPVNKEILDKGLVLWFPGEDSCEFHVHGGIAVVNSVLNGLGSVPNLKLAAPGEFTRRAFYNGKLDLMEVEGLADLLQAETEIQRKQAFLQTQGSLSKIYNKWRAVLLKSLAHIEAHIDFEETETIDDGLIEQVLANIKMLQVEIEKHLSDGRKGELLRNGVKTVILGEPNVGKSSLLNILCKRPAAIVTPIEGTTRDVLEVTLNINGYPLVLADTAGLRNKTDDIIEMEGIKRALSTYKTADLVIVVVDLKKCVDWLENNETREIFYYLKFYLNHLGLSDIFSKPNVVVCNKLDLVKDFSLENKFGVHFVSCKNEVGVSGFVEKLTENLKILCGEPSAEHPSMNQMRHRQHLNNCLKSLSCAIVSSKTDTVLMAEDLRKSLRHLGHLVGITTTEQLLDVIFKDFCIGK